MALMEFIGFDEQGNCLGGSFMDYLIPTSMEVPDWETGHTVTPSPHHPIGAKGIGESATVGSPPAVVNAVVDALAPFGVAPHGHALHARPACGRPCRAGPPRRSEALSGSHGAFRAAGLRHREGGCVTVTDTAAELTRTREPFVQATVVRAQKPTSAHAGDTALVRADGTIDGFVGGTCAEASVREYGLMTLSTNEPLLLRIVPGEAPPQSAEEGAVTVANPCLSGGSVEIFLEPRVPAPRLLVVGDSPIAEALAELGRPLGYAVELVPGQDAARTPTTPRSWSPRTAAGRSRR